EPADPRSAPGAVVVPDLIDAVPLPRRDELERDLPRLLGREPLFRQRHEFPVDAGPEHVSRFDMQVGRAALHGDLEDLDHASCPPQGYSVRNSGDRSDEAGGGSRISVSGAFVDYV